EPLRVLAGTQIDLSDTGRWIMIVKTGGVDMAAGDEELRTILRPACGGRHLPDRGMAHADHRPAQHVDPLQEVNARECRPVDGRLDPAVGHELTGGQVE